MGKVCKSCGAKMNDDDVFCGNCGVKYEDTVEDKVKDIIKDNMEDDYQSTSNTTPKKVALVTNRSILLNIFLSFITCGIYYLYWIAVVNDDANIVSGETNDTNGGLVVLFSILTCGIYTIYWYYKMGKKLFEAGLKHNIFINDNSLLYLLLAIFIPSFSIVNIALIQNDLNEFSYNEN